MRAWQTSGQSQKGFCRSHDLNYAIKRIGCWDHARRKFVEASKAAPQKKKGHKVSKADIAVGKIRKLYRIEAHIKDLEPEQKKAQRQKLSLPVLDNLKLWLEQNSTKVPKDSLTYKAIQYTLNQWEPLVGYCEDGWLNISNVLVENAVRPFAVGRRNKGAAGYDGQTLGQFDEKRDRNLYKIWNRLSSGSYLPPPVREKRIPKGDGRERTLGIPTVSDRIAQGAVKQYIEARLDPIFHPDSYGYRLGKSAHQALQQCTKRCWQRGWVLEVDISAFFDNVRHDLVIKALEHHQMPPWVILYCRRWLEAPMWREGEDENLQARNVGTPQGGVISPLLANLFLHYAFDQWMGRHRRFTPFERYADDIVCHCSTMWEAVAG